MVVEGSYMGYLDVGEMFLNFILHLGIRQYCGVDLTNYFPEEISLAVGRLWEAWQRTGMDFTWSHYQAVQGIYMAE